MLGTVNPYSGAPPSSYSFKLTGSWHPLQDLIDLIQGFGFKGCTQLRTEYVTVGFLVPIRANWRSMPCKSCASVNQSKFTGEIGIHFPGLKNIDKSVVWVFPELIVCLDCGTAEFLVPAENLQEVLKILKASEGSSLD